MSAMAAIRAAAASSPLSLRLRYLRLFTRKNHNIHILQILIWNRNGANKLLVRYYKIPWQKVKMDSSYNAGDQVKVEIEAIFNENQAT